MPTGEIDVITGAFGYTGKYITRRLLAMGRRVRTLTGHPNRPNPFGEQVNIYPFNFDNHQALVKSLEGADTLYNTYWIRFEHGSQTFDQTVSNTQALFRAAREAGVRRIVHSSITNPAKSSRLPYFKGKAIVERSLVETGLSYSIVRPTVIFGDEGILINNIAWLIRHFPVFPIFGSGTYRLQPIYVEDMADLVVQAGQREECEQIDAAGPDQFTYEQLVRLIAEKLHRRILFIHVPPLLPFYAGKLIEPFVGDVLITRDEITGLMANLLISDCEQTGHTHLAHWLAENAGRVGKQYASELGRHYLV